MPPRPRTERILNSPISLGGGRSAAGSGSPIVGNWVSLGMSPTVERSYRGAAAGSPRTSGRNAGGLSLEVPAQQVLHVVDLVGDEVELLGEALDLGLGAAVDVEVHLAAEAV